MNHLILQNSELSVLVKQNIKWYGLMSHTTPLSICNRKLAWLATIVTVTFTTNINHVSLMIKPHEN